MVIIGVLTDFFGTMLTCFGLKSTDPNKKYKYYRVGIYALIVAGKIHFRLLRTKVVLHFIKKLWNYEIITQFFLEHLTL